MQKYLWWRDFLDPTMLAQVRDVALSNQHKFVPTSVSTGLSDYRRSSVLWHYEYIDLYNRFTEKLRGYLPLIQDELGQHFDVSHIEVQMTSSSHQGYFKQHNDNGTPDTETRRLTFVYYFLLNEPRAFEGGELVLSTQPTAMTIQPNHNSIVWFASEMWHEVMPVTSTGRFEDSRMTLNGWIRTTTP